MTRNTTFDLYSHLYFLLQFNGVYLNTLSSLYLSIWHIWVHLRISVQDVDYTSYYTVTEYIEPSSTLGLKIRNEDEEANTFISSTNEGKPPIDMKVKNPPT